MAEIQTLADFKRQYNKEYDAFKYEKYKPAICQPLVFSGETPAPVICYTANTLK